MEETRSQHDYRYRLVANRPIACDIQALGLNGTGLNVVHPAKRSSHYYSLLLLTQISTPVGEKIVLSLMSGKRDAHENKFIVRPVVSNDYQQPGRMRVECTFQLGYSWDFPLLSPATFAEATADYCHSILEMRIFSGQLVVALTLFLTNCASSELQNEASRRMKLESKVIVENTSSVIKHFSENVIQSAASVRSSSRDAIESLKRELKDETSYLVDFSQMPTSCIDLKRMGQQISGIFLVKGSKNLETVYCSFHPKTGNETQQWIGYADVKSVPVHFYAQKNSTFDTTRTPIPFDSALVNEGNAMNLTSGIFTAPRSGTYFFSFTGAAVFPTSSSSVWLGVVLYLNGVKSGMGHVEEANTVDNQSSPLNLQSTLNLKSGDEVWVQIDYRAHEASLFGNADYGTHFTGFMLEEEIIASL
ncbi:adipocyte complement related protein-like protein of 30 kDa [Daphnia pulex]|uniref:Adipocyte complement related protein-like protein of 30 kDa n=1 Tax=Daphnia pulex TaxID=6669 RepID=E9GLS9_DAPPU|nr:adipocyte complement related protein-like protein of 30 kDa [Daphnia pulex]|eukprot:EFX79632.1 adipocyte complement related protein-like protein of 30 kDa [Daphnia pulex]